MKIERLIGILFYILNRECVSATLLAKQFGVSRRTILRDIDTLSLAGIPIYSEMGPKGGYSINRAYKLNEKLIDSTNSEYMLLALKSLKDLYGDKKVTETYEKVKHIFTIPDTEKTMEIDLSVINENNDVVERIRTLKQSIQEKINVTFEYTNAQHQSSLIKADILHIFYKWYAWYAFGYNCDTNVFRMYKIVRMRNLKFNDAYWLQDYDIEKELKNHEEDRPKHDMVVRIAYKKEIQTLVEEYFPTSTATETENTIMSEVRIKSNDFILFSILLGFGDKIKVLSPPAFALHIQKHMEQTLKIYKNSDI